MGREHVEISQLLLPSLMTGGIAGAGRGGFAALIGGLGAESAMEAAVQNEADEVALSRYLALRVGNLVEPFYGEEAAANLTKELLNGSVTSRLYLGALATAQVAGFTLVLANCVKLLVHPILLTTSRLLKLLARM